MARARNSKAENQGSRSRKKPGGKPWLEWVFSAIGLVVALSILIFLFWDAALQSGKPPELHIETGPTIEHRGGFTVPITVHNVSPETASQVEVEGALKQGNETIETARAVFDHIPGNSTRGGGLFFTQNPNKFEVTVRALGFSLP